MWWRKQNKNKQFVGIEVRENGIAVALCQDTDDVPLLQHIDYVELENFDEFASALSDIVKRRGLQRQACNIVLDPSRYQLLLIEQPEVPEEELREAVRWKLKDLINFPVENAALDIFTLPQDVGGSNRRKMVYVVVSEKSVIREVAEGVKKAGLKLASIDISEMALRNISIHLIDPRFDGRGVALARIRPGKCSIAVFKKGNLYLSRQFDLSYNGGLLDDLPAEALALELQRSLDYYERQMSQAAPGVIYICGDNVTENKIAGALQEIVASSVQYLDVSAAVRTGEELDPGMMQLCLVASGAALRRDHHPIDDQEGPDAKVNHAAG